MQKIAGSSETGLLLLKPWNKRWLNTPWPAARIGWKFDMVHIAGADDGTVQCGDTAQSDAVGVKAETFGFTAVIAPVVVVAVECGFHFQLACQMIDRYKTMRMAGWRFMRHEYVCLLSLQACNI